VFVKRFVANDMQEAIRKINSEFGPDAVILQNKNVRKKGVTGLLSKPMVEVVAAYEPSQGKNKEEKSKISKQTGGKPIERKEISGVLKEKAVREPAVKKEEDEKVRQLYSQIAELKNVVSDFSDKMRVANREAPLAFSPDVLKLYNGLIEHDVAEELSGEIAAQAQSVKNRREIKVSVVAENIIIDRLGDAAPLRPRTYKQNIILFVGPTGAGKTTTLAKLAGSFKFRDQLDVGIINTDTYRVGALEQAKKYAEIMDIPIKTAYNPCELKEAVRAMENRDVVLIDTAGKNVREESNRKELEEIICAAGADEVFLVMSIDTGFKACRDIIRNFSFLSGYKLILTKLDEVSAWGNALNIASLAKRPLSYVTMGQNVPEDIQKADIQALAGRIAGCGEAAV
jgi:flagellar biosynthesis protein FlhF